LRILDIYPLQLPVKGSFAVAMWNTIFITSNKHPTDWYEKGMPPELDRRIHHCIEFKDYDSQLEEIRGLLE